MCWALGSAAVGLDTGPGREPPRDVGVQRWGADVGDRRAAVRPPRLPERRAGVPQVDTGGFARRLASWLPVGGRRGQLVPAVLRAGFGVAVPDRQLRRGVLLGVRRSVQRSDGDRRAAPWCAVRDPRHDRRHVVPVGHGHRPSRPGSRRGRQVLDGGTRLSRSAARQRVPRLSRPHDTGDGDRPRVHGRQRSGGPGRGDPQRVSRFAVCAGCAGFGGRHLPGRARTARGGEADAGDALHRGVGPGVQHSIPG
jgi:hypothetical protein